ncbi:MAG: hypothetical protein EOR48_31970 [Mesorhizobium sp.]|nr:MAG: hypothetical protein EOR48_31970 [Mesorhizobium sp.]
MSSVIDGSFESGWCQQPDLTGELSMTTAKPLARYSAIEGALASGFATAELHHLWGRDLKPGGLQGLSPFDISCQGPWVVPRLPPARLIGRSRPIWTAPADRVHR